MYGYDWTVKNGIFRLSISGKTDDEIRPVFKQELDYFGFNKYWSYPDTDKPLLWAKNVRWYIVNGEVVAEARGGGFYTKPKITITQKDLRLEPINIDFLWKENIETMKALEQKAVLFVRKNYEKFKKLGYKFVCAFSGGKDSLVLLDLVSKALSPDEFYVIFGDTGMELSSTYEAVERAKKRYPNLNFIEAATCHMTPEQTWKAFGPPGRRMRWCCAVHKSTPTILRIREATGDYNAKAVICDGIRAEESTQRAGYEQKPDWNEGVIVGAKNINQVNCSPIYKWNAAEVFLYLLANDLIINDAYRVGLYRVGCKICPMSSNWWDGIANDIYKDELSSLLTPVEEYAKKTKPETEVAKFIESGGWKARMGGRGLANGGNRITEVVDGDSIRFLFSAQTNGYVQVAPIIGKIVARTESGFTHMIDGTSFECAVENLSDGNQRVTYKPYSKMDRFVISKIRGIVNKAAYCCGCKVCIVQCPNEAFIIKDNGNIFIRENKCCHCGKCISFCGKGCLVAKSLSVTGGSFMDLSGINRYQHFGLRKAWLEHFFELRSECFIKKDQLGNRQYDALKVWLREAGLLSTANRGEKIGQPTELFDKLVAIGQDAYMPLTWAVIWINLAYNSKIARWYMIHEPLGVSYNKGDLIVALGDEYSESTRDNAVTALLETFRNSPIGDALKQGISFQSGGTWRYKRQGWEHPDAVAVLYALYRFAEETGRYAFALSQLDEQRKSGEAKGMDPIVIFGIAAEGFKEILKEIAVHYGDYIKVSFQAGLDNVALIESIKSIDVLDLANNNIGENDNG